MTQQPLPSICDTPLQDLVECCQEICLSFSKCCCCCRSCRRKHARVSDLKQIHKQSNIAAAKQNAPAQQTMEDTAALASVNDPFAALAAALAPVALLDMKSPAVVAEQKRLKRLNDKTKKQLARMKDLSLKLSTASPALGSDVEQKTTMETRIRDEQKDRPDEKCNACECTCRGCCCNDQFGPVCCYFCAVVVCESQHVRPFLQSP